MLSVKSSNTPLTYEDTELITTALRATINIIPANVEANGVNVRQSFSVAIGKIENCAAVLDGNDIGSILTALELFFEMLTISLESCHPGSPDFHRSKVSFDHCSDLIQRFQWCRRGLND